MINLVLNDTWISFKHFRPMIFSVSITHTFPAIWKKTTILELIKFSQWLNCLTPMAIFFFQMLPVDINSPYLMLLLEVIGNGRPLECSMAQRTLTFLTVGRNTVNTLRSVSRRLASVDIEFRNGQLSLALVTDFCGVREVSVVVG